MTDHISKNLQGHFSRVPKRTKGMNVIHSDSLTYVDSGLSCDTFNVIHIQNGRNLTEEELTEAVMYFRERKLDFCIWVSEEDRKEQVRRFFSKIAVKEQAQETGMVLDLTNYEFISNTLHQHITEVDDLQKLTDYAQVIAQNWTPADENVLRFYQLTANSYLDPATNITLLVFYQDGKPVSSVELFPTDQDTIGFYGFATLQAYRGRGIGSALTTYCLNKAKKKGYQRAILQASEDSVRIYKKMGFKEVNTYLEYA